MCGPLTSCCYCLPIRAGLYLTGVLLSFLEIAAMAHNIYLVTGNQKEYFLVTGNDSIDHFALALTGICLAYVSMLTINIVMMFGVYKHNRWCLLPWLIFYFFLLFVVFFSVPLVLVWFLIIQDGVEIFSLLALAPLLGGILLLCAWTHVNGLYVKVGLDELEGSNFKGPMTY